MVRRLIASISISAVLIALMALPETGLGQEAEPLLPQEEQVFQQEERLFEGELIALEIERQTITIRNPEETATFAYNSETEVRGTETDIQGLARRTGSELRITYISGHDLLDPLLAVEIVVLAQHGEH